MRFATILVLVLVVLLVPVQMASAQASWDTWWPVPTKPVLPWLTPEDAAVGLATSSTYWQRHYRPAMIRSEFRYSNFSELLRTAVGSPFSGQRMRLEVFEANQAAAILAGLETHLTIGTAVARIDRAGGGFDRFGPGYFASAGFGLAPFPEGLFTPAFMPELHGEIMGFGAGREEGSADDLAFASLRVEFLFRVELVQGDFVDSQFSWNFWFGVGLRHTAVEIDGVAFPTVTLWEWTVGTHAHLGRNLGLTCAFVFPLDVWAHEDVPLLARASLEWVFG